MDLVLQHNGESALNFVKTRINDFVEKPPQKLLSPGAAEPDCAFETLSIRSQEALFPSHRLLLSSALRSSRWAFGLLRESIASA